MPSRQPEIRCPRLGHQVTLAYCYREAGGRPCRRLLLCWEESQPRLRSVVARLLSPEEWERYFETEPPPKVVTLVKCIQDAKESGGDGSQVKEDPPGQ